MTQTVRDAAKIKREQARAEEVAVEGTAEICATTAVLETDV